VNPPELSRERARRLRREMTDAESKLWSELRARQLDGVKFRRQVPIGPFIADFCAPERKLIVELDGEHHLEQEMHDRERTRYLEHRGYRVVRFWNDEVLRELDDVLERIQSFL
jgi:very-short-patch-repair endonuclease